MTAEAPGKYRASCAGCNERWSFDTVEELEAWASAHCCWQEGDV